LSRKILFVHNALTTFVAYDLEILQGKYRVEEYFVKSDLPRPWRDFLKVYRSDLVFCWFASAHSLLPVFFAWLLRKPSVVVIGGYDVANLPEINYGHQRGGFKKLVTRLIFRFATILSVISEFNHQDALKAKVPPKKIRLIYCGIPVSQKPQSQAALPGAGLKSGILTVGNVNESNLERKGLRLFVEAARLLPEMSFVVAGKWADAGADKLKTLAGPNVTLTGHLSGEALTHAFDQARIYVQASRHEAFGVAVAEAMLHGCIPVLAWSGALPEVGGDCAVYAADLTPQALVEAIRQAADLAEREPTRSEKCRQRIRENFSLETRRQKLYKLLADLFKEKD
jgi:glycosyltransferase involved in cell wall biosynthesis